MQGNAQSVSSFASQPIVQQDLKRCRLRSVPYCSSVVFFILSQTYAFLFCFYGLENIDRVVVSVPYGSRCTERSCLIPFEVPEDIPGPVGLYYRLTKFSQMRREIATSYSSEMLAGKNASRANLDNCKPEQYFDDQKTVNELYVPCGLLPRTVFNDSFSLIPAEGQESIAWDETDIALDVDRNSLYKPPNSWYDDSTRWLEGSGIFPGGQTNPHFIVWMRQSAFTPFRKLFAKTKKSQNITRGNYTMSIVNRYNTTTFQGEKYFVLAHIGGFGTMKYGPAIVFGVMSLFFLWPFR